MTHQQFLRIDDVISRTTLSKDFIYKKMKAGTFPRCRRIGKQAVAWIESEINEWIESQPEADPNDWRKPERQ